MPSIIRTTFLLFLLSIAYIANSQTNLYNNENNEQPSFEFVNDDMIIAALDSLHNAKYFEVAESDLNDLNRNKFNFPKGYIPQYHDSVYYYRMQKLNVSSPITLNYNQTVKSFIDLYAQKKRGTTARVLGLAHYYFPLFEQILDKYGLPLELKYLAIVESALNPTARSRMGAGGLWQFMYYTGKIYGLDQNSYVDDRNDPLKATIAACQHFKDLYNMYNDWGLVLAAYNSGAGNVNKAIRRSGGKMTFWEIRPYLPKETRDYVPAFIAVNYIMAYSQEHNIFPVYPKKLYSEVDTITVKQPLSFQVISEKLGISIDDLEFLNPTFKKRFIPATPDKKCILTLPHLLIGDFINNEEALYAENKLKDYSAYADASESTEYQTITQRITHKVKSGESISKVASRYGCSVADIKKWNKLKKNTLYKGQFLKIYKEVRREVPATTPKEITKPTPITASNDSVNIEQKEISNEKSVEFKEITTTVSAKYHKVKKGETLSSIASKYRVSQNNLKTWNNLRSSKIMVGQSLRINAPTKVKKMVAVHSPEEDNQIDSQPESNNKTSNDDKKALYHTVAKGEFLAKIAAKYNVTVADLMERNDLSSTTLYVGQKIRINPLDSENQSNETQSKAVTYTVKAGDTIWSVAKQYEGVTISQIKEWNNMSSDEIKVGQKLTIHIK